MEYRHGPQTQRFELKYLVGPERARAIRDFVSGYLEPDAHARASAQHCYPVYSVYLDTATLALCRQSREGVKNRFKLRMRFYDGDPASPVFLEVKRREADVICKERAAITREGARLLLQDGHPGPLHLFQESAHSEAPAALESFRRLRDRTGAGAAACVAYLREAYVSPESNRLRITFDRDVCGSPFNRIRPFQPPQTGVETNVRGIILEIKFTDRFPGWVSEMVQAFNLQRCSICKYDHCVSALGLRRAPWLETKRGLPA
jgi:hypothetical protein